MPSSGQGLDRLRGFPLSRCEGRRKREEGRGGDRVRSRLPSSLFPFPCYCVTFCLSIRPLNRPGEAGKAMYKGRRKKEEGRKGQGSYLLCRFGFSPLLFLVPGGSC